MKKGKICKGVPVLMLAVLLMMTLPAAGGFIWTNIDNFESYTDTADLNSNASLYNWAADGSTATYSLATDTSNSGDQSIYCKLDPRGWGTYMTYGLRFYEGNGIDLRGNDVLSMSLRGSSSLSANNNVTGLRFQVADMYGALIVDQELDLDWATSNDWNTIEVATGQNWQWGAVRWIGLRVNVVQYNNPDIWLDDFKVGVVPEPTTMALFGIGAGIVALRRKRAK